MIHELEYRWHYIVASVPVKITTCGLDAMISASIGERAHRLINPVPIPPFNPQVSLTQCFAFGTPSARRRSIRPAVPAVRTRLLGICSVNVAN